MLDNNTMYNCMYTPIFVAVNEIIVRRVCLCACESVFVCFFSSEYLYKCVYVCISILSNECSLMWYSILDRHTYNVGICINMYVSVVCASARVFRVLYVVYMRHTLMQSQPHSTTHTGSKIKMQPRYSYSHPHPFFHIFFWCYFFFFVLSSMPFRHCT